MLVTLLLIAAFFVGLTGHYFIAKKFSKLVNPTAEEEGSATNRLGLVLAASIGIGLIALFVGKMSAATLAGYFLYAISASVSYSYFRGKILKAESGLKEHIVYNLRANAAYLTLVGLYLGGVFLFLRADIEPQWLQTLVTVTGVVLSLLMMAAFAPLVLAIAWGCKDLQDQELLTMIRRRLKEAGLPALRIQLLPMKKQRAANAMVTGLTWMPEFARARIFLSDSLVSDFSKEEVDSIVAHEVAHFSEGHLLKRMYIPFFAYFFAFLASGGVMLALSFWSVQVLPQAYTGFGILVVSLGNLFYGMFYFARLVVRNQELDADWAAIHQFRVPSELYFSTLDKIHVYSGASLKKTNPLNWFCAGSAHPTSEERRRLVNEASVFTHPPFAKRAYLSGARAMGVMVLVWVVVGVIANPLKIDRSLASESKPVVCGAGSFEE